VRQGEVAKLVRRGEASATAGIHGNGIGEEGGALKLSQTYRMESLRMEQRRSLGRSHRAPLVIHCDR
jgi:hypothetical protein